jgi:hypothetical protein
MLKFAHNWTAFFVLLVLSTAARAEMQFPRFEQLSVEQQQKWGYTVKVMRSAGSANLSVEIPPAAAKVYKGARLYFWDGGHQLLGETSNFDLTKRSDGSLTFSLSLFRQWADAELVIYSAALPGASLIPDFGGFTFYLPRP